MIAGFIVAAQTGGNSQVIVRALGPSLGKAGVADPLVDPKLELRNSNGALVAANDDWKSTQQAAIQTTGVPPSNDLEAAIVATPVLHIPSPRASTRERGRSAALVEVYNLEPTAR